MTTKIDLLTPFSPELTIREAAQMGRVSCKQLTEFIGDIMDEAWTEPDHHIPGVMAAAAVAVVKQHREAEKLARTIQTELGPLVLKARRKVIDVHLPEATS